MTITYEIYYNKLDSQYITVEVTTYPNGEWMSRDLYSYAELKYALYHISQLTSSRVRVI
jgi:hypothetical protein